MNKYVLFAGDQTLLIAAPDARFFFAVEEEEVTVCEITARGPQWRGVSQRDDQESIEDLRQRIEAGEFPFSQPPRSSL